MGIDIPDIGRFKVSLFQGQFHNTGNSCTFRVWSSDVVSIRCHTATKNFSINRRTSGARMLIIFKNHATSTFTENKSIPIFIIRAGGSLRTVIAFT